MARPLILLMLLPVLICPRIEVVTANRYDRLLNGPPRYNHYGEQRYPARPPYAAARPPSDHRAPANHCRAPPDYRPPFQDRGKAFPDYKAPYEPRPGYPEHQLPPKQKSPPTYRPPNKPKPIPEYNPPHKPSHEHEEYPEHKPPHEEKPLHEHEEHAEPHDSSFVYDCDKKFLLFEFTTIVPVHQVKEIFNEVLLKYSFKVIGTGHYFFVVKTNHTDDRLKWLQLPTDAIHTAAVRPLESINTFLKRLLLYASHREHDTLDGHSLVFVERTWPAADLDIAHYKLAMRRYVKHIFLKDYSLNGAHFVAVGRYPTQFLYFLDVDDCHLDDFLFKSSDSFGGPCKTHTRIMNIHPI